MPTRRDFDHIGNRNFMVEIEGVTQGAFAECSGVEVSVDVLEFRDGTDLIIRKRPGNSRVANVVLKRGYVNTTELWDWMEQVLDGQLQRRAMSIILLDEAGEEIARYNLYEAWPCRWRGFAFEADGLAASIEELEIVAELVQRG